MSDCRRQIILVTMAPINEILISRLDTNTLFILLKIKTNRINPYPPNFRRIAASTIDPAIGASTCALGNHKWVVNIGSFTRNPNSIISQI